MNRDGAHPDADKVVAQRGRLFQPAAGAAAGQHRVQAEAGEPHEPEVGAPRHADEMAAQGGTRYTTVAIDTLWHTMIRDKIR